MSAVETQFATPLTPTYGAGQQAWDHFDLILDLSADLLPVVSNPNIPISPNSQMAGLGKTPSRINGAKQAAGFTGWTKHIVTDLDIKRWRANDDYGICVRTGGETRVYAIDADVTDAEEAKRIYAVIEKHLGTLPYRDRPNSTKFLVAMRLDATLTKRAMKTKNGIIEMLGAGQQFIACGMHPSGTRYAWDGGLPLEIPFRDLTALEACWAELESTIAIAKSTTSKAASKADVLNTAAINDPVAVRLFELGMVLSQDRTTGKLNIDCPFPHNSDNKGSSTSYFPANTGGYAQGHFA